MNRIKNTGADYEATKYEIENGLSPQEAWELVIKNFKKNVEGKSEPEKAIIKKFYFNVIGQMFE